MRIVVLRGGALIFYEFRSDIDIIDVVMDYTTTTCGWPLICFPQTFSAVVLCLSQIVRTVVFKRRRTERRGCDKFSTDCDEMRRTATNFGLSDRLFLGFPEQ